MRKQTITHAEKTEPANPLLNTVIIAAVALAIAPAVLFGAARILHARADAAANAYEIKEATPKRSSVTLAHKSPAREVSKGAVRQR